MPLLTGLARSTQIGDFAAASRLFASAVHGAAIAAAFIAIEIVARVLLLRSAARVEP
jgi:hypothetical protein